MQDCFEQHLRSVCAWSAVEHLPAEGAEEATGEVRSKARAKFPFGKQREIVSVRFGLYDLTAYSSHEAPPLGKITITGPGDSRLEENSLDPSAWKRVGEFVAKQESDSYV